MRIDSFENTLEVVEGNMGDNRSCGLVIEWTGAIPEKTAGYAVLSIRKSRAITS